MENLHNPDNLYYKKFVNEENIKVISEFKIRQHFWVYYFSFYVFCGAIPLIFTFVGFNFQNPFAIGMFIWNLFLLFWLVYYCIRFNLICYKYKVFKKKISSYLFSAVPIILSIVFSILPLWTTTFIAGENGSFSIRFNPIFFFFIFLPLYLGYLIYCYYAFMKCFGKFANKKSSDDNFN
ncbi:MAG: hypothetical protein LKJ88_07985 [Bacilli bacterium]|nr:hypothetical protein [Bacilli bacterium]